jgi:prevent-host-death family protein
MERIGVRELRQHASRYLALVKAGQSVEVTERGELIAVLSPPAPARTAAERLIAEGRLRPPQDPAGRLWDVEPVELPAGAPSTADVLADLREERL